MRKPTVYSVRPEDLMPKPFSVFEACYLNVEWNNRKCNADWKLESKPTDNGFEVWHDFGKGKLQRVAAFSILATPKGRLLSVKHHKRPAFWQTLTATQLKQLQKHISHLKA